MTEKTDAWMPLWIGAYLADTQRLTTVQHGAYLLLLMAYWRERAPLPDNDEELRAITKTDRSEWKRLRPVMARFFKVEGGIWWHKRVESEMVQADNRKAAAIKKAQAAAEARWKGHIKDPSGNASGNAPSIPEALPEDLLKECPTPSPSSLREEKKGARKRTPAFNAEGVSLPPSIDRDLWTRWCACRKAQGKPITEDGASLQIAKLAEYEAAGHSGRDVLEHAIASGNRGLFPPPRVMPAAGAAGKTYRERDNEAAAANVRQWTGGLLDQTTGEVIEMENPRAPQIRNR